MVNFRDGIYLFSCKSNQFAMRPKIKHFLLLVVLLGIGTYFIFYLNSETEVDIYVIDKVKSTRYDREEGDSATRRQIVGKKERFSSDASWVFGVSEAQAKSIYTQLELGKTYHVRVVGLEGWSEIPVVGRFFTRKIVQVIGAEKAAGTDARLQVKSPELEPSRWAWWDRLKHFFSTSWYFWAIIGGLALYSLCYRFTARTVRIEVQEAIEDEGDLDEADRKVIIDRKGREYRVGVSISFLVFRPDKIFHRLGAGITTDVVVIGFESGLIGRLFPLKIVRVK